MFEIFSTIEFHLSRKDTKSTITVIVDQVKDMQYFHSDDKWPVIEADGEVNMKGIDWWFVGESDLDAASKRVREEYPDWEIVRTILG